MTNVIPPALSKVGQNVLETQLDHLVQQVPEMKQVKVSDNEWREEPVTKMHTEVVIKVVFYILPGEITVVIIGVVPFCNFLVQFFVKESKKVPSIPRPVIKHTYNKAEVY